MKLKTINKKLLKGYKLIEVDEDAKVVRVLHEECGIISERKFTQFYDRPACPVQKCVSARRKKTNIKKYGALAPAGNIKIQNKIRSSWNKLDNYIITEKRKNSILDAHGKDFYKKIGAQKTKNISQKDINKKISASNKGRKVDTSRLNTPEAIKKRNKSRHDNCLKKHGVPICPKCFVYSGRSQLEEKWFLYINKKTRET